MKKKMILAGFACLLLFLVSVAKSDPHRPQPQKPVMAAAPPNTAVGPATSNHVRPRKGHAQVLSIKKKIDTSSRE